MKRTVTAALALASLGACANYKDQKPTGFVLGGATRANIAIHSVRDPALPNSEGIDGQSGERAVAAVRASREPVVAAPTGVAGGGN